MQEDTQPADANPDERPAEPVPLSRVPLEALLVRLLVGGELEATDELRSWLSGHSPPGAAGAHDSEWDVRVRRVLIGLLVDAYVRTARGVSAAERLARGTLGLGAALLAPLRRSPLLAPVRWPFEVGVSMGWTLVERWERMGALEEERSRDLARKAAGVPIQRILDHLRDDPRMRALVQRQAEALLDELPESERVDRLVQTQADNYIEYLRENPQPVRDLISGQSLGLAQEMMNTLRYQAYQLDTVLETIVRGILRRTPRDQLPPPPPEVRRRALQPNDWDVD